MPKGNMKAYKSGVMKPMAKKGNKVLGPKMKDKMQQMPPMPMMDGHHMVEGMMKKKKSR